MKTFIVRTNDGNRLFIITSDDIETALNQLKNRISNLPSLTYQILNSNDIIDISITYSHEYSIDILGVTWLSNDNIYVGLKCCYLLS
jgi:hypothetical protein